MRIGRDGARRDALEAIRRWRIFGGTAEDIVREIITACRATPIGSETLPATPTLADGTRASLTNLGMRADLTIPLSPEEIAAATMRRERIGDSGVPFEREPLEE